MRGTVHAGGVAVSYDAASFTLTAEYYSQVPPSAKITMGSRYGAGRVRQYQKVGWIRTVSDRTEQGQGEYLPRGVG